MTTSTGSILRDELKQSGLRIRCRGGGHLLRRLLLSTNSSRILCLSTVERNGRPFLSQRKGKGEKQVTLAKDEEEDAELVELLLEVGLLPADLDSRLLAREESLDLLPEPGLLLLFGQ